MIKATLIAQRDGWRFATMTQAVASIFSPRAERRQQVSGKLLAVVLAGCCEIAVAATSQTLNQRLIDQAQYWLQRGREDNAADAWRKLLKLDPNNVDALVGLGTFEAQNGDLEQARVHLAKLKQLQPNGAQTRLLDEAVRKGGAGKGQLDAARTLARKGDNEAAVERFKSMGDPEKLKGDAALEYFQILSGTLQGFDHARRGAERLVKENPGNDKYSLGLAQILTYRENSRRDGIHLLAELQKKSSVSKPAAESWRQALTWMGIRKGDEKLYQAFLERFPDDKAIRDRLDNLTRPQPVASEKAPETKERSYVTPLSVAQTQGYKALEAGDLKKAEAEFNTVLKLHPNDPSGLGGLGLVKMQQESFAAARDLIRRAIDRSPPDRRKQWAEAYTSASYYGYLEEATTAQENSEDQKGIELLRKAIAVNDKDSEALLRLADALLVVNDYVGAEANFRRAMAEHPDDERPITKLFGMLVQQKRNKDALKFASELKPEQRDKLGGLEDLQVRDYLDRAKAFETAGDLNGAQQIYEDALLFAPNNVWVRMALAKMYQRRGMPGQARSLLEPLLTVEHPQPEAYYVSAMLSAEQRLWWEGLETLEKVPENARGPEMAALQKHLWIQVQFDRADAMLKQGARQQAGELLKQIEEAVANDSTYAGAVAAGYFKLGETARGYTVLRNALAKSTQPTPMLRLQYADALLRTGQEAEGHALMRQIAALPNLTEDETAALKNLKLAFALRQAEAAREAGNLAAAYDHVAPLLAESPDEPQLQLALARMYSTAGDTIQAADLYAKVLSRDPDNLEARQGMVYAGIQIKDYSGSEEHMQYILKREPSNPRFIALAGRLERAQGHNGKALDLFKQALELERNQHPLEGGGVNGLRLVNQQDVQKGSSNPFAGMTNVKGDAPKSPVLPRLKEVEREVVRTQSGPDLMQVPKSGGAAAGSSVKNAPMNGGDVLPGIPTLDTKDTKPTIRTETSTPVPTPAPVVTPLPAPSTEPTRTSLPTIGSPKQTLTVEEGLQQEIDAINAQNRSSVTVGAVARARSGQVGLSQLKDTELPIELQMNTLGSGRFGLKIIPVQLDAGVLNLTDPNTAALFGRNAQIAQAAIYNKISFPAQALQSGLSGTSQLTQESKGVALALSFEIGNVKADVGTSPQGFPLRNVVGGLRWSGMLEDTKLGIEASRRSVSDSYLSYAGTSDSLYGLKWGGVTKNGLRGDASHDNDDGGYYGTLGFASLMGNNVAHNTMWELGAGAYWHFYRTRDTVMTTGLNLTAFGYRKNLGFFTYGQGGYFSPQNYIALGIPIEAAGRSGKLSYQIGASLGFQKFRQSESPYYPNNPDDQASLQRFAAANPTVNIPTTYAGQSSFGIQYKLGGSAEYRFAPHFFLGGRLSVDNSGDFTDASGLVYLRYYFEPQKSAVSFPPVVIKPYYLGY